MFKTLFQTFFTLVILVVGPISQAQLSSEEIHIGVGAEIILPFGDLDDIFEAGYGFGVQGVFPISGHIFGEATLRFDRFVDNSVIGLGGVIFTLDIFSIQAGARYYIGPDAHGLFLNAGLGLHPIITSVEYTDQPSNPFFTFEDTSDIDTEVGFNLGAGYTFGKVEAGLRYQLINDLNSGFLAIGANYRFM